MSSQTSTAAVNNNSRQRAGSSGEGGRRYPAGNWLFCIHVASERRERRFMEAHMLATATRIIFHIHIRICIRILGPFHVPVEATLVRLSHNLDVCCLLFLSLSLTPTLSLTHSLIFSPPFIFFCFAAICHSFSFSETKIMFCQQVQAESNGITKIY